MDNIHQIILTKRSKLQKLKKREKKRKQNKPIKPRSSKKWYEKFRWFYSSERFLCIGGRDATTNETVIKKHTGAHDLVFHTAMTGSPFFVIQSGGKKIGEINNQKNKKIN